MEGGNQLLDFIGRSQKYINKWMGFIVTGWNQTIIAYMVSIFRKIELIKIKLILNLITF